MWWAESARLYLSQRLVLLEAGSARVQEFAVDDGLSLKGILEQLGPHAPRGARLAIHLSGTFCPAVDVAYPAGMERFRDRETFARSVCASRLDVPPDQLALQLDPVSPRVAAPLRLAHLTILQAWAKSSGCNLSAVKPLWSIATAQRMARTLKTLVLREPDSVTLLGTAADSDGLRGMSLPFERDAPAQPLINRMHFGLGTAASEAAVVCFAIPGASVPQDRPACWAPYWAMA